MQMHEISIENCVVDLHTALPYAYCGIWVCGSVQLGLPFFDSLSLGIQKCAGC